MIVCSLGTWERRYRRPGERCKNLRSWGGTGCPLATCRALLDAKSHRRDAEIVHCRTSDSEILLNHYVCAIVKYCRELLFIESQYTYEQPQTNFMYIRGSISFLHHHEVKNPGNRSRREMLLNLFGITYRCYYKPSPPSSTNYTSVLKYVILTAPINFFYPKSALLCDSQ